MSTHARVALYGTEYPRNHYRRLLAISLKVRELVSEAYEIQGTLTALDVENDLASIDIGADQLEQAVLAALTTYTKRKR